MTDPDLRIAQIARATHRSSHSASKNKQKIDGFKKILKDLEHTLHNELALNRQKDTSISSQDKAEKKEKDMREQIMKHHFEMLKLQIAEKEEIKQKEKAEKSANPIKTNKQDKTHKSLQLEDKHKETIQVDELKAKEALDLLEEIKEIDEKDVNDDVISDLNSERAKEEAHLLDVIRRYEKTFGRIKELDRSSLRSRRSSVASSIISSESRPRTKSVYSNLSTVSQQDALERLEKLRVAEEKIKKEKEELMNYLETRSNRSSISSRMTTVSSLFPSRPQTSAVEIPSRKTPLVTHTEFLKAPREAPKSAQVSRHKDPVGDLIRNLDI